jgi:hypothetical protein
LVGRVTLAIDAERHVPLRVQVYPVASDSPAFTVEFTQVSFTRPDPAQFRFAPPPGATVKEEAADPRAPDAATAQHRSTVIGNGWTSVLVAKLPTQDASALTGNPQTGRAGSLPLDGLPTVSGGWGSGHLLTGRLFSVLLTADGRVLAGAVRPERLYTAAG